MRFLTPVAAGAMAALLAVVSLTTTAVADPARYPDKPINVIVGFAAGGGTDVYARIIGKVIPPLINDQPLVIVNQAGGAQVPAMRTVASATPDGYTLQFVSTGSAVLTTMLRERGVDWFEDFRPIAQVGGVNIMLAAPKDRGFETPQDLAEAIHKAHAAGRMLRWGHPGRGAITNLAVVAWLIKNDLIDKVQDVPFQGGAPTRVALIGGQVDFGVLAAQHIAGNEDTITGLAIFSDERDPVQNHVPTMAELGMDFVPFFSPMVLAAPAKVPDYVIEKLDAAVKQATETDEFKQLAEQAGLAVRYRSSKETMEMKERLREEWRPTIEFIKTRMDQ